VWGWSGWQRSLAQNDQSVEITDTLVGKTNYNTLHDNPSTSTSLSLSVRSGWTSMKQLPEHGSCFLCGTENSHDIGIHWFVNEKGVVLSEFTLRLRTSRSIPDRGTGAQDRR